VKYEDEKPIFNLGLYQKQKTKLKRDDQSQKNILLWSRENLKAYLRGAFDGSGLIYSNPNGKTILSIQHDDFSQVEMYQKVLEMLDIQSFTYYPIANSEPAQIFIVGKINVDKFKNKIGIDDTNETNRFFSYLKGFDWED